jgi:hypothetical protein
MEEIHEWNKLIKNLDFISFFSLFNWIRGRPGAYFYPVQRDAAKLF